VTVTAAERKKPRPKGRGFLIDAWQRLRSTGAVSAKRKKRLCEADQRVTVTAAERKKPRPKGRGFLIDAWQ
jgi:hypothetical protein